MNIEEASPANVELVRGLVEHVADPDRVAQRLAELRETAVKAAAAVKEAEAATKKAHDDQINAAAAILDAQQRHEKQMAREREAHERAMAEREAAVVAREQNAADLERQASQAHREAERRDAQSKARLERMRKAAAE